MVPAYYTNILILLELFVLGSALDELSARELLESFGPAVTDAGNITLSDDDFELNNFILYEEEPESVFNNNEARADEAGQSDSFERNGQSEDNPQGTDYKYGPFKSESLESEEKQEERTSSDYFEVLTIDPGVYTSENNFEQNIVEDSITKEYRSNEKKIQKAKHQGTNDKVKMNKESGTNFNDEETISSISNTVDKERNREEKGKYNTQTNTGEMKNGENSDFATGEEETIKKVVRKKPRKLKALHKDKIYLANLDVPESPDSVSMFFENEEGKKLMCAKADQKEKMSTDEDIDSLESELKDTATEIEYLNNRLHEQKMNSYSWEDIIKEAPKHSETHRHHYPTQESRKKVISNLKYILSSDDKNDKDYFDDGPIPRARSHERNEEKLMDLNNKINQRSKLNEIKRKKWRKFDRGNEEERLNRYIYEKSEKERLASRISNDIKKELYNKYKELETDNTEDEELLENKFKKVKRIKNMGKNGKIIPKRRHKTPNSYTNTDTDFEEEKGSGPKSFMELEKQFSNTPVEFSIQYDEQSKWSPEDEEEDDDYRDEYGADEELEGEYGSIFQKKENETPYEPDMRRMVGSNSSVQNNGELEMEQDGGETKSPYTWEVPAVETHSSVKKDKPRRKIKSIGGRRHLGSHILVGPLVKKVHFKREIIQPPDHICQAYHTFLSDVDMFKSIYNKVRKPYFSPPATENQLIDSNKEV